MTGGQRRRVVVGIIDDGIAFAHERFRTAPGSRVHFVWLQDGVHEGAASRVDYGREIWKVDDGARKGIDTLLAECTHNDVLDEDEFYLRAGLVDFRRPGHKAATWRIAHGTHVMDLACGYDPAEARTDICIVAVQLPARTTANTSGGDLTPYAIDALWYIRDRADELARGGPALPVVVNFSYGMIGGPHDGTSELELMIDDLIRERRRLHDTQLAVVLPAGNSHLSRCHAELAFGSTQPGANTQRLQWRVLPDDQTPSFVDIWMPERGRGVAGNRLKISIAPPGGAPSPGLGEYNNAAFEWRPRGAVLCSMQYNEFPRPTERGRFRITIRPTADLRPGAPLAPAGTWTITLENVALDPSERVHAWVQRDDSLYGYPRSGRQSYFDDEHYRRFDAKGFEEEADDPRSPVKRASLINSIGTGRLPIVVGGFVGKGWTAAKYSSGGPTTPPVGSRRPNRAGPDAMAISEDSIVHAGVLAAGSRSGSVVSMGGTSVATPQITRLIAEALADGDIKALPFAVANAPAGGGVQAADPDAVRDAVKDAAERQEAMLPVNRKPVPAERRGWGRIKRASVVRLQRFWD